MVEETDIVVFEAPLGSDLYRQALALREAILRRPLGLSLTADELVDDETRQHFCALLFGRVVGSVSLKPLGEALIQLKQMAVAQERQRSGVGRQLLAHAEVWASSSGFQLMVLNARIGAEGFYAAYGYLAEGEVFEEHTLPHVKMTKRLDWPKE
jgi:predicted GNAT family N-acyltransferase